MEALTYNNIALTGFFSPIVFQDIQIRQVYNEHATVFVGGYIPQGQEKPFIEGALDGERIGLVYIPSQSDSQTQNSNQPSNTLFAGLATFVEVKHVGNFYTIGIHGVSFSMLLDLEKEYQSFQNINQTHDDVIRTQMDGIDGDYINEDEQRNEPIEKFTLKYHETRWGFIKRLVSRHHVGLLPDVTSERVAYWVGMPQDRKPYLLGDIPYKSLRKTLMGKDIIENARIKDATDSDFRYYALTGILEHFNVGDKVILNQTEYYVLEVFAYLDAKDAVLRHDYIISSLRGTRQPTVYNKQIQGLSLEGAVIDVVKDFSKLHLYTIDPQQNKGTATWFRHTTYYTAGKDRGWCSMPELGHKMSLHFPTWEENDCYLLDYTQVPYEQTKENTLHSSGSAKQKKEDKDDKAMPNSKFYNSAKGQVQLIQKDLMLWHTAGNYSSLALHENHTDERGKNPAIALRTNGYANLQAQNIYIGHLDGKMAKKIIINSEKGIDLTCALSSVSIDAEDGAHFKSPKLHHYPKADTE